MGPEAVYSNKVISNCARRVSKLFFLQSTFIVVFGWEGVSHVTLCQLANKMLVLLSTMLQKRWHNLFMVVLCWLQQTVDMSCL